MKCVSIFVSFQNNADAAVGGFKGIYQYTSLVNGKASWSSSAYDIWFLEEVWYIGLSNLGLSQIKNYFGNLCPFNMTSEQWWYHDSSNGWTNAAGNEINVQCLDGNYTRLVLLIWSKGPYTTARPRGTLSTWPK